MSCLNYGAFSQRYRSPSLPSQRRQRGSEGVTTRIVLAPLPEWAPPYVALAEVLVAERLPHQPLHLSCHTVTLHRIHAALDGEVAAHQLVAHALHHLQVWRKVWM